MKHTFLPIVAALLIATPLQAEMTSESCAVSWGMMTALAELDPSSGGPTAEEGRCVVRNAEFRLPRMRILMDEIRWELTGLEALLVSQSLLDRAEISIRGLYPVAETGMASFDYAFEAQARAHEGISVDILVTHLDGAVMLDRFDVDFPGDNALSARLHLEDVQPLRPELATLHNLHLAVTSNGLFESYALMPLATTLLSDVGPVEPQIAAHVEMVESGIAALPEEIFPESSKQALLDVLHDLPNPTGTLTLDLLAPDGVPLGPIISPAVTVNTLDPIRHLTGAEAHITYRPSAAE